MDVEILEDDAIGWLAVEEDGTIHRFPSEAEACAFQRGYRVANKLDAFTGELK